MNFGNIMAKLDHSGSKTSLGQSEPRKIFRMCPKNYFFPDPIGPPPLWVRPSIAMCSQDIVYSWLYHWLPFCNYRSKCNTTYRIGCSLYDMSCPTYPVDFWMHKAYRYSSQTYLKGALEVYFVFYFSKMDIQGIIRTQSSYLCKNLFD